MGIFLRWWILVMYKSCRRFFKSKEVSSHVEEHGLFSIIVFFNLHVQKLSVFCNRNQGRISCWGAMTEEWWPCLLLCVDYSTTTRATFFTHSYLYFDSYFYQDSYLWFEWFFLFLVVIHLLTRHIDPLSITIKQKN